jgi:hypothetical protein
MESCSQAFLELCQKIELGGQRPLASCWLFLLLRLNLLMTSKFPSFLIWITLLGVLVATAIISGLLHQYFRRPY